MFAVLGVILIVVGAIVAFAVEASADGVDLSVVGFILIAGGVALLLAAAVKGAAWQSRTGMNMRVEKHVTADGKHAVEEVQTN